MPPTASAVRAAIPRRRNPALLAKLPPPKLPIFRSVVAHPPAPFAVPQKVKQGDKGKAKEEQPVSPTQLIGPHQVIYTTAPRALIPLTASPSNHKLWNPPAPDSDVDRGLERDESGRLARFAARFEGMEGMEGRSALDMFGLDASKELMEGDGTGQGGGQVVGRDQIKKPKRASKQQKRR
ncbi:hypothetical protein NBRC10512_000411 [Rhodotorula toruloides]|uniref:RHTO0S04e11298g1_1 n=2 Tax=Rhodotorula toruloides TaxID=5286 RepID=A0A061AQG1_RHOTO|nr:uncharacterized protein RHTO_05126 [Rhodotorula toruloides NP11]EMS19179.1 hypothetical protein RHTO_05126 [Rhodotorula toruloides NP11]CDR39873.1 RHTO0S04e11298g1_1 [Rhodotorula toruloides]